MKRLKQRAKALRLQQKQKPAAPAAAPAAPAVQKPA
jgi:hypothetical protein